MALRSPLCFATVLLAPAVLAGGCGAAAAPRTHPSPIVTAAAVTPPPVPRHTIVTISNYGFHPERVTVPAGGTITFVNHDQTAHTATSHRREFDVTVEPGARTTVTASKPGTYSYYCEFHAFMHGVIVVR